MSLTPQNMESRDGMISHSIFRDIARMDKEQLGKYIRMAFTGNRDVKFLPTPFWDYRFDVERYGESDDGRTPPGPGSFFSEVHNMIAGTKAGIFTVGYETDEQPNFEFRSIYRAVLGEILDECASIIGEPTDEQRKLASHTVEAVGSITSPRDFNLLYREMKSQGRGNKEMAPITLDYPAELTTDLEAQAGEQSVMLEKSQNLINEGRFGQLQLHYRSY